VEDLAEAIARMLADLERLAASTSLAAQRYTHCASF
jgi:hypothetical protein